jgi:hypothetical protein
MFKVHDYKLVAMEQAQSERGNNLLHDLLDKFHEDKNNLLYDNQEKWVGFTEKDTIYLASSAVTANLPKGMTKQKFNSSIDKSLIVESGKNVTRKHINNGKAVRYDIFKKPTA